MRRLAALVALAAVTSLGFGAALVLAGSKAGTPATSMIAYCQSLGPPGSNNFKLQNSDASSLITASNTTAGGHTDDIIPPFYWTDQSGTTMLYPGNNMGAVYPPGYSGADIFANSCAVPTGGITGSTVTVTTTVPGATTITVTDPPTTVTVPPVTITAPVTVTISQPGTTVTAPGTTTVVTVPPDATTTVTIPADTVTLPSLMVTAPGQTVDNPPLTVTQPGTTTTITGGTTTTVVTVVGPKRTVEGGVLASKATVVTVTTPGHVIHVPARLIHTVLTRHTVAKELILRIVRACQAFGVGRG